MIKSIARVERVSYRACANCGTKIAQAAIAYCPTEYKCPRCGKGANSAKIAEKSTRLLREVTA